MHILKVSMRGRFYTGLFLLLLPAVPLVVKVVVEASSAKVSRTQFAPETSEKITEFRTELLMGLDLFVRAQRALRSENNTYTRSLGRMPDVLGAVTSFYKVDVVRATRNQLLVVVTGEARRSGMGESAMLAGDRVAIDESFRVNSNFPLPLPPRDYLYVLARSVLNRIAANQFQVPEQSELDGWEGTFRHFFRYEVRPVSQGGRTLVAVGLAAPVKGEVVGMGPETANIYEWVYHHRHAAWVEQEMRGSLERIYIAQKIHSEHTGSYAASFKDLLPEWNALSSLSPSHAPFEAGEMQLDPNFGFHAEVSPATDHGRQPSSDRAWSINAYGQVAEVDNVESLVDEFEQARKKVARLGDGSAPENADNPLLEMSGSDAGQLMPQRLLQQGNSADSERGRKPLIIDAVDGP